MPTSGPLLILPPSLKRWGPPRRQGLSSHLAHKWATSDSSPRSESWALRTLKAASIDMIDAPPLLVAQIYNKRNSHWVLRLLLVSPTRTFLCLVFDPLYVRRVCTACNKPYIAGANTEELAIVNLIAEQEGIEARAQKRWDKFLGDFGSVAFAIAPLYSTFLHQDDFVSRHPACLLMLHCLLSRRVVNGSIQLSVSVRPTICIFHK